MSHQLALEDCSCSATVLCVSHWSAFKLWAHSLSLWQSWCDSVRGGDIDARRMLIERFSSGETKPSLFERLGVS